MTVDSLLEIPKILTERLKSPLLSSFAIAAAVLNYKAILVLTSLESYVFKFDYLEKMLYPSCGRSVLWLFVYPFIVACFYTFCWPYIDGWLRVYAQWVSNSAERRLLKKRQQTPFDEKEQLEYFKKVDADYEALKARAAGLYLREKQTSATLTKEIEDLKARLKRQVRMRLADQAQIHYLTMEMILDRPPHEVAAQFSSEIKKIATVRELAGFVRAAACIEPNSESKCIASIEWLRKLTHSDVTDFLEILVAMDLVAKLEEPAQSFVVLCPLAETTGNRWIQFDAIR